MLSRLLSLTPTVVLCLSSVIYFTVASSEKISPFVHYRVIGRAHPRSLFKFDDAFYLAILGDSAPNCGRELLSIYVSLFPSLYFSPALRCCYLNFVRFLRCDCSHVALFICLLPLPYSLRRNIRARHCDMFRRGTRADDRYERERKRKREKKVGGQRHRCRGWKVRDCEMNICSRW